jgi:tetratricopeptide (TPR) repeat protein
VRSLEQSGNWNVLVLYASEWTRKEPDNATAWTALSNGYLRMRQWDDALDAAKRVVTVAPESAASWRNLGHVEVALERWPEARSAFDKSLALKADDLDALCGAAQVANAQGRAKDAVELTARVAQAGTGCPDTGSAVRSAAVSVPRKPAAAAR